MSARSNQRTLASGATPAVEGTSAHPSTVASQTNQRSDFDTRAIPALGLLLDDPHASVAHPAMGLNVAGVDLSDKLREPAAAGMPSGVAESVAAVSAASAVGAAEPDEQTRKLKSTIAAANAAAELISKAMPSALLLPSPVPTPTSVPAQASSRVGAGRSTRGAKDMSMVSENSGTTMTNSASGTGDKPARGRKAAASGSVGTDSAANDSKLANASDETQPEMKSRGRAAAAAGATTPTSTVPDPTGATSTTADAAAIDMLGLGPEITAETAAAAAAAAANETLSAKGESLGEADAKTRRVRRKNPGQANEGTSSTGRTKRVRQDAAAVDADEEQQAAERTMRIGEQTLPTLKPSFQPREISSRVLAQYMVGLMESHLAYLRESMHRKAALRPSRSEAEIKPTSDDTQIPPLDIVESEHQSLDLETSYAIAMDAIAQVSVPEVDSTKVSVEDLTAALSRICNTGMEMWQANLLKARLTLALPDVGSRTLREASAAPTAAKLNELKSDIRRICDNHALDLWQICATNALLQTFWVYQDSTNMQTSTSSSSSSSAASSSEMSSEAEGQSQTWTVLDCLTVNYPSIGDTFKTHDDAKTTIQMAAISGPAKKILDVTTNNYQFIEYRCGSIPNCPFLLRLENPNFSQRRSLRCATTYRLRRLNEYESAFCDGFRVAYEQDKNKLNAEARAALDESAPTLRFLKEAFKRGKLYYRRVVSEGTIDIATHPGIRRLLNKEITKTMTPGDVGKALSAVAGPQTTTPAPSSISSLSRPTFDFLCDALPQLDSVLLEFQVVTRKAEEAVVSIFDPEFELEDEPRSIRVKNFVPHSQLCDQQGPASIQANARQTRVAFQALFAYDMPFAMQLNVSSVAKALASMYQGKVQFPYFTVSKARRSVLSGEDDDSGSTPGRSQSTQSPTSTSDSTAAEVVAAAAAAGATASADMTTEADAAFE